MFTIKNGKISNYDNFMVIIQRRFRVKVHERKEFIFIEK